MRDRSSASRRLIVILIVLAMATLGGCTLSPLVEPTAMPVPAATPATKSIPSTSESESSINDVSTDGDAEEAVDDDSSSGSLGEATPNRLIHEQSPYLLQHAYNPIDWYPWGDEAFEAARRENKPIFLSIGYSTCHWCHVMEEESFSDPAVAERMNEAFVAIKVDREERPDIDAVYMNVAMLLNGSGGWPLNIIMTPDQQPFFAATYIPKESRFQLVGLMELIPRVQQAWTEEQDALLDVGEQITQALNPTYSQLPGAPLDLAVLSLASDQFARNFDPEYGGFGPHPKFPSPHTLLFLLRQWHRTGDETLLNMVETTLQAMRNGGIYDQLGYGFHRYSTDTQWLVPHFEKMLYDQAMLAMAYTEAYLATGDNRYRKTAEEIFTYVERDMTASEGGFFSAEDADSEGEEGFFYLWTVDELKDLLGAEAAALAIEHFGMTSDGNYFDAVIGGRTGKNILFVSNPESDEEIESIRQQLYEQRETRIHPYKDDKILTDWNGLMIAALARAAQAFDEPAYALMASDAADFLLAEMRADDGRLLHRYRNGDAAIPAKIDDYAFLIWGLLDLYEATFDQRYLKEAIALNEEFVTHFWDGSEGGFYFTGKNDESLLARPKEGYDGAVPSGNSAAMLNLLRLGRFTGETIYEEQAAALARAFANQARQSPTGFAHLLSGLDFAIGPSLEIVVVGETDALDTEAMISAVRSTYTPNKVVLLRAPGDDAPITELADFTRYQYALNDTATAYVCRNYVCEFPTTDIETMIGLIESAQFE